MKVGSTNLNKKAGGPYRSLYRRKRVYQRPIEARRKNTGLIVVGVMLGLAILIALTDLFTI